MSERVPTPEQTAAIEASARDVLVEAGAGTGKTGVMVERYCRLVCEGGASPDAVLAFTFTDKAAAELRQRIRAALERRAAAGSERARDLLARIGGAWVTTIHGFCNRLLAAHPVAAGIDPRFRVLDAPEAERAAREAFDEALEGFLAGGEESRERDPGGVRDRGAAGDRRRRPRRAAQPRRRAAATSRAAAGPAGGGALRRGGGRGGGGLPPRRRAAGAFRRALRGGQGAARRDRLRGPPAPRRPPAGADGGRRGLPGPLRPPAGRRVPGHQPAAAAADRGAARAADAKLMAVGDELQSIYGFRHADLDVFREQRDAIEASPDAAAMELSGNFRSRPELIGAVNALGERLLGEAFRPLRVGAAPRRAAPRGEGPAVELLLTARDGWDAEGIELEPATDAAYAAQPPRRGPLRRGAAAGAVRRGGCERGEMVVLLRAFTHLDAYEDSLERAGLRPYVVGGPGYWSQQQVADACALLATIANPLDDRALFGALASPACGVAPDTLWLLRAAAGRGRSVWPALERAVGLGEDEAEPAAPARLEQIPAAELALLRRFAETIAALRLRAHPPPPRRPDRRRDRRDRLRPRRADAPGGGGALRQPAQADAPRGGVRAARGARSARPARLPRDARRRRRGARGDRRRGPRRGPDHDRPQRQGARVRRRRRALPLAPAAGRRAVAAADARPRRRGAAGRDAAAPARRPLGQPLLPRGAAPGGAGAPVRGGAAPLPRRRDAGPRAADPQRRGDAAGRERDQARHAGHRADRRRASGSTASATPSSRSPRRSRARASRRASRRPRSRSASTSPPRSGPPS